MRGRFLPAIFMLWILAVLGAAAGGCSSFSSSVTPKKVVKVYRLWRGGETQSSGRFCAPMTMPGAKEQVVYVDSYPLFTSKDLVSGRLGHSSEGGAALEMKTLPAIRHRLIQMDVDLRNEPYLLMTVDDIPFALIHPPRFDEAGNALVLAGLRWEDESQLPDIAEAVSWNYKAYYP